MFITSTLLSQHVMLSLTEHGEGEGEVGLKQSFYAEVFMNQIKNTVINNNYLTPSEFYLSQNYPNPFSERTSIKFCIAYNTRVKLEVFNADGEWIETLVDEDKEAGTYEVEFSTLGMRHASSATVELPAGVYLYQLQAGDFVETKKMILLK